MTGGAMILPLLFGCPSRLLLFGPRRATRRLGFGLWPMRKFFCPGVGVGWAGELFIILLLPLLPPPTPLPIPLPIPLPTPLPPPPPLPFTTLG